MDSDLGTVNYKITYVVKKLKIGKVSSSILDAEATMTETGRSIAVSVPYMWGMEEIKPEALCKAKEFEKSLKDGFLWELKITDIEEVE